MVGVVARTLPRKVASKRVQLKISMVLSACMLARGDAVTGICITSRVSRNPAVWLSVDLTATLLYIIFTRKEGLSQESPKTGV